MQKQLLNNEDDMLWWMKAYAGKGIDWREELPTSYPCIICWYEYDISNSMAYGSGLASEFIYPDEFGSNSLE